MFKSLFNVPMAVLELEDAVREYCEVGSKKLVNFCDEALELYAGITLSLNILLSVFVVFPLLSVD